MTSDKLAKDYLRRARVRRLALDTFLGAEAYADVVRESQEIVELLLKAALRFVGLDPPKRHDVGGVLLLRLERFPAESQDGMRDLVTGAAWLAEERAHAFYGDEAAGIGASELFGVEDARRAMAVVDQALLLCGGLLEPKKL